MAQQDHDQHSDRFGQLHPFPSEGEVNYLYRYRSINGGNEDYVKDLLVYGKLYHSAPAELNDPFECRPMFQWPSTPQDAREMRKHVIKQGRKRGLSLRDAEKVASRLMSEPRDSEAENLMASAARAAFGNARLCCFTTHNDNLLMWSHYAESHSGFCIEFDAKKPPFANAFKVNYDSSYPWVTYPLYKNDIIMSPMLTKSTCWSYENEYRIIVRDDVAKRARYQGSCAILRGDEITRVWLGVKMKPEFKEKVLGMIKEGPFSPEIYCARMHPASYALDLSQRCMS